MDYLHDYWYRSSVATGGVTNMSDYWWDQKVERRSLWRSKSNNPHVGDSISIIGQLHLFGVLCDRSWATSGFSQNVEINKLISTFWLKPEVDSANKILMLFLKININIDNRSRIILRISVTGSLFAISFVVRELHNSLVHLFWWVRVMHKSLSHSLFGSFWGISLFLTKIWSTIVWRIWFWVQKGDGW